MNRRERIRAIVNGETADWAGFWLGNPHTDTWPQLRTYFNADENEDVRKKLGDDIRWI